MLTPVQQRTLDTLRRAEPDVSFDQELVDELLADATTALDELGARLGGQQLVVTKHAIGTVLACEAHHLEPDDFSWSPARAKGSVAHKAIQLLLNWRGEPAPADIVDEALARLADEERSIGDYVAGLSEGEAADLRSQSVDLVTKFIECFPPLDRRWHPVTEAAAHHPVDGPIVLRRASTWSSASRTAARPARSSSTSSRVAWSIAIARISASTRWSRRSAAAYRRGCWPRSPSTPGGRSSRS